MAKSIEKYLDYAFRHHGQQKNFIAHIRWKTLYYCVIYHTTTVDSPLQSTVIHRKHRLYVGELEACGASTAQHYTLTVHYTHYCTHYYTLK